MLGEGGEMTARSTWKQFERRVAWFFGGQRVPLSGGNSGHTRADVMGVDGLFIEAKLRAKSALWTLYENTKELAKAEGKIPVCVIGKKFSKGFLIVVHSDDLDEFERKRYKLSDSDDARLCVICNKPPATMTTAGAKEWEISQICEPCFDEATKEMDDE
jgi:hypothetical protein